MHRGSRGRRHLDQCGSKFVQVGTPTRPNGVNMTRNLHAYLKNRRRKSLRLLRDLLERPEVVTLANEVQDAESKWSERQEPDCEYFCRMTEMRKFEFAEIPAGELV